MESSQEQLLRDLEARKQALRDELNALEDHLEDGMQHIQENVSGRLQPTWWIRKYPLRAVGIAVAAGLVLGFREKSGPRHTTGGGITFSGSVIAALKAYAARRAVDRIVEIVENSRK